MRTAKSLPSGSAPTASHVGTSVPVLRIARVARGLTQEAVGRAAGLSPGTISRLENGHEQPMASTVQRLSDALEFPAELLFPDLDGT